MAGTTYTVVGQARVEAENEALARHIAFNSEVEWTRHYGSSRTRRVGAVVAAAFGVGVLVPGQELVASLAAGTLALVA